MESIVPRVFDYQSTQVRTALINDQVYLMAPDVCRVLELHNPTVVMQSLESDEHAKLKVQTSTGFREVNFVNEYGLYRLVLQSRKSGAREFARFIFHEVIPDVLRKGSYVDVAKMNLEQLIGLQAQITVALSSSLRAMEQDTKLALDAANKALKETKLLRQNFRPNDDFSIIPDMRQRLIDLHNEYTAKYIGTDGRSHEQAWHDFDLAFNRAFHTNFKLLVGTWRRKNSSKGTRVDYLYAMHRLNDGVRVLQEMVATGKVS